MRRDKWREIRNKKIIEKRWDERDKKSRGEKRIWYEQRKEKNEKKPDKKRWEKKIKKSWGKVSYKFITKKLNKRWNENGREENEKNENEIRRDEMKKMTNEAKCEELKEMMKWERERRNEKRRREMRIDDTTWEDVWKKMKKLHDWHEEKKIIRELEWEKMKYDTDWEQRKKEE